MKIFTAIAALAVTTAVAHAHDFQTRKGKRKRFDWDHAVNTFQSQLLAPAPIPDNLNCDQAIDELLLQLPAFGSLFYMIVNGWYIGQWADYSSCLKDASDSQYILATVSGDYTGPQPFTRGGQGKFTDGLTTRMGLCFPKQCTKQEVRYFTSELIEGYAKGAGWENVQIDYHMASQFNDN